MPDQTIASAAAIVLAGGSGIRAGIAGNKVYARLAGRTVIEHGLLALEAAPEVAVVILVVRPEERDRAQRVVHASGTSKVAALVPGSDTRHGSETRGLAALRDHGLETDLVAVHDAARPFITADLIAGLAEVALVEGGAVPGVPIEEAVVQVDDDIGRVVVGDLVHVQTPQVFASGPIMRAYTAAAQTSFKGVDTAETVAEFEGLHAVFVPSDPRNIKITHAADLRVAERIAREWTPERFIP